MVCSRVKLIGCPVVVEEILPFLPTDTVVETLDAGLHIRPEGLRDASGGHRCLGRPVR